jgi:hypothetical protein
MKIKLKEKPEHVALIKAMGSKDGDTSKDALKVFAQLVGPLAKRVLDDANIVSNLYESLTISEYEPRTIPLDDYHDVDSEDYFRIFMASKPGDLSYNMTTGADDIAVATFTILHAVGMYKKYLRAGRIAHAEKAIKKLMNEFVNKEKVQAIQPILDAIASSQTGGQFHVIRSTTANQVTLNDFNRLMTKASRS